MAVGSIVYSPTLSSDTNRGYSKSIWGSCPLEAIKEGGTQVGVLFEDDFLAFPTGLATNGERAAGQWNVFIGNNAGCKLGTSADTTNLPLEGGILGLTCGSNNNLSISLQASQSSFRFVTNASGNA